MEVMEVTPWPHLKEAAPWPRSDAPPTSEDEQSTGHLQPFHPGLGPRPQLDGGQPELPDRRGEAELVLGFLEGGDAGAGARREVGDAGQDVRVSQLRWEVGDVLLVHEAAEEDVVPTRQDLGVTVRQLWGDLIFHWQ